MPSPSAPLLRALTISAHGGLDRLELRDDLPVPDVVAPTDVRVRLQAAALNHLDLFVLQGMPGVSIAPPWIMGADGAGIVDAVGREVRDVAERLVLTGELGARGDLAEIRTR